MTRLLGFCFLALLVATGPHTTARAQAPEEGSAPQDAASAPSKADELNKRFLDPDLDIEEWEERFETESRDIFRARAGIVSELKLAKGTSIADIGAGTGLFVPLFADAVGDGGKVYAVDISPRFLEHLRERVRSAGLTQVQVVTGKEKSVELSEGSVDVVFVCATYHHFGHPQSTLASIHRALRPGGSLVIVEFDRVEGESPDWILDHVRADKATFRAEIERAGFALEREIEVEGLDENYMQVFRRAPSP